MSKKSFLENLQSMSKEEIDRLIKKDGKQPKLIKPIWFKNKK